MITFQTFDSFRLIIESIFFTFYYKAFCKHEGETLLTCCSTHWEGRGGISPLTYVKLHIILVKLQLTGKSSLTYQLYFSIHFRFQSEMRCLKLRTFIPKFIQLFLP